jgi:hypothetical protein
MKGSRGRNKSFYFIFNFTQVLTQSQFEKELGHNSIGGRVTYLATKIATAQLVVIKQFQFATVNSSWSDYDAYQSEIKTLKSLADPSIPAYLDSALMNR